MIISTKRIFDRPQSAKVYLGILGLSDLVDLKKFYRTDRKPFFNHSAIFDQLMEELVNQAYEKGFIQVLLSDLMFHEMGRLVERGTSRHLREVYITGDRRNNLVTVIDNFGW